jgi:hypothetical protein
MSTICGTPFQRKAKLTYIPHLSSVVSNLWSISFRVLFNKSDPVEFSHAQDPAYVLSVTPLE